jgi:hypothetical protein
MVEQIFTVYFHSSRWAEGKRTGSFFYSRAQAERARLELEQRLTEAEKAGGGHFAIRKTHQPVNEKGTKGNGNMR